MPAPTDTRPIVISGPSGVGKGTLYKLLLDRHPNVFATTVSNTTRDPRPGETRDVDYYYISMSEFDMMIEAGRFVEHAQFGGNKYGTSRKTIEDLTQSGKVVVLDIEMEGVKQIQNQKSSMPARYVFIAPPNMIILESRLRGRGTEKEESIQKRLEQARKEIEFSRQEPCPHDIIIVNNDLETAYKELEAFIYGNKEEQIYEMA